MNRSLRTLPTVVLAVAVVLLSIAGSATAAKLITGKQIKNSSVTGVDLNNGSVKGGDIAYTSVDTDDVANEAVGKDELAVSARRLTADPSHMCDGSASCVVDRSP